MIKQSESTIRSAYIEVSFPSKIVKRNQVYGFTFQPKIQVNSSLIIKNNFFNFSISNRSSKEYQSIVIIH